MTDQNDQANLVSAETVLREDVYEREAERQGLRLVKYPGRRGDLVGTYELVNSDRKTIDLGGAYGLSLDDVATALSGA